MRWIPLQNAQTKKWKLGVIHDDCKNYDVTELESEHVEKIVAYADYMNRGWKNGMNEKTLSQLEELKHEYGMESREETEEECSDQDGNG